MVGWLLCIWLLGGWNYGCFWLFAVWVICIGACWVLLLLVRLMFCYCWLRCCFGCCDLLCLGLVIAVVLLMVCVDVEFVNSVGIAFVLDFMLRFAG